MKHALRQLAKSPGFTAVAILILALGIGFSASSFSVANFLLLRNLPYPEPERLVRIFSTAADTQNGGHAPANIFDIRDTATSFKGIAIFNPDRFSLGLPGEPAEEVSVTMVSANFFDVLATPFHLGRGFAADEDHEGKAQVTVLSYGTWMRRFAGDPAIIGQTIRLDARNFTVVGVLPATFDAPTLWGPADFFCPRPPYPGMRTQRDGTRWMQIFGRLNPGVSSLTAQTELDTIARQLALAYPKDNTGRGLRLTTLHDSNMNATTRTVLWLMTALSLAMMLIACANLASLQMARALGRHKDFAVRAALGGNRWQLMAPLLAEGLLIAIVGGVAGLLVAVWSNALVGRFLNLGIGTGTDIPIDGRVLGFAALSALLCGLAFSLLPAWLSARASAGDALKENSRGSTSSRGQHRVKSFLVVTQLSLAFMLVGVAASFGVGFKRMMERNLGWRLDGLVAGDIILPSVKYGEPAKLQTFFTTLFDRLTTAPGLGQVAVCSNLPTWRLGGGGPTFIEGRTPDAPGSEPLAYSVAVTSNYFATLGIPLQQGTDFTPGLKPTDPAVAIVNESFAKQFWPGANPIGRRIRQGWDKDWLEVIGVVGDVQVATQMTAPASRLQLYRPLVQGRNRYLTIVSHSSLDPAATVKTLRATVAAIDPDLPLASARPVKETLQRALANNDLIVINFAISAGMGLLIAAVGLAGVISQLAQQRTRDIGIRLALGARSAHILRLMLGESVKLLVIGLLLGVVGYCGVNRILTSQMSEIDFPGLWLLALNLAVLSTVMLAACYLPARRATKVDPLVALRAE